MLTGGGAVLNVGKPQPGQTVAVVGLGGVGMAAVMTALSYAGVHVIAVDQLPEKLTGATHSRSPRGPHPATGHRRRRQGRRGRRGRRPPRRVGDVHRAHRRGGRTITVGLPRPDARISVSPLGFVAEGRSLIGSYLGSAVPDRDIPQFVELWRSGRLPVESLVSSRIALDDINAAMDNLADGTAVRQLITF